MRGFIERDASRDSFLPIALDHDEIRLVRATLGVITAKFTGLPDDLQASYPRFDPLYGLFLYSPTAVFFTRT
jgi:hypothetical protein